MSFLRVIIVVLITFSIQSLPGQCPGKDSIFKALKSGKFDDTSQLGNWLKLEEKLGRCHARDTIVAATVARRISTIYWYQANYTAAANYANKSTRLLQKMSYKPKPALIDLSDSYRLLSLCYDRLGEKMLRMEVIDSVISIERQADTIYTGTCLLGRYKVQWLFEKGDYRHCVNTGEIILDHIRKNFTGDSIGLVLSIVTYQVQAYMFLDEMAKAWQLVNYYAPDFKNYTGGSFAGVYYNLVTSLHQSENNATLAASNIRRAFKSHLGKYPKGCAESMYALANVYLDMFKKPDSAMHFAKNWSEVR